jgi:YDG domain-containing protein/MBG domain-containing protein/Big-like domain-containing protein
MLRTSCARLACIAIAAVLLLLPRTLLAQQALVYCPIGIDATGCNAVVAAIAADATRFPGGVDAAYDGTGGTVDLATADLASYSVLVVPSLADGPDAQPYSLLRDGTIAARIRAAFVGRTAVWSGTPDVGSTSRSAKDGLIRNLAGWASADAAGTHGPGLVGLQDNSDDAAGRYGWLAGISGVNIGADTTLEVYSNVEVITSTGRTILTNSSGLQIGYTNMASAGLVSLGGLTKAATGGRSGRTVLATAAGDPSDPSIATVRTDKEDYAPGETVTITGSGWEPGETVSMKLHEDPLVHGDRTLSAVADADGKIFNNSFKPEDHDVGVRFVLDAVGLTSGRTAQTTFTDAVGLQSVAVGAQSPATVAAGNNATFVVTVQFNGSNSTCSVALSVTTALPSGVTASFSQSTVTASNSGTVTSTLTLSTSSTTPAATSSFTVQGQEVVPGGCNGNGATRTGTRNLVVGPPAVVATSLALAAPSPTTVVFGSPGPISLSATLTRTTGGAAVSGGTVTFSVDGSSVGTGTTNSSGVATLSYNPSALNAGTRNISAAFAAATISGTNYAASTSNTQALTVNQAPQAISFAALADRSLTDGSFTLTATGGGSGNAVTFSTPSTACSVSGSTLTPLSVGTCAIAANQAGNLNYLAAQVVQEFQVTKGTPTIAWANPADITYGAALSGTQLNATAPVPGGFVYSPAAGTVLDAGNGQALSVTFTPTDGTNYGTATKSVVINVLKRPLTVAATGQNKVYDGSDAAAVTLAGDPLAGDVLTLTYTGAKFSDKHVGTQKTVTVSGIGATGADAGNYAIPTTATTKADITERDLVVTATGVDKPYDGTKSATVTLATDKVSGDAVAVGYTTAEFADKNVGTAKPISVTGVSITGGADAGNYKLANTEASASANITPIALTASFTVGDKVYDGTDAATIATRTLGTGVLQGDVVTLQGGTATFADKNLGNDKTVTATGFTLTGGDAGNYTVNSTATDKANITPRTLTVTATAADKVYDRTTAAAVTLGDDRVDGDQVTLAYASATFASKNVGAHQVTVSGISIASGQDKNNYTLGNTQAVDEKASITPAPLEPHITASNKVYDATKAATITAVTVTGIISPDVVTISGGTATFADKNVGTQKTVTGTGFVLGGADEGNYALVPTEATTKADITKRDLKVTATGVDKVYDGTDAAEVTLAHDGIAGDALTPSFASAKFDDKNVGQGKTVTVSGIAVGGADAGNYKLLGDGTAGTKANITTLALVAKITAKDKEYDGTTAAEILTRTLEGVIEGDDVELTGGTASFEDKNAGIQKKVTATGLALAGGDKDNYSIAGTAETKADISQRPIAVAADPQTKEYGPGDPSLTYKITSGSLVSGDAFTGLLTRDPGEDVAGSPYDIKQGAFTAGPNYDLTFTGSELKITKAPLAVTASNAVKNYGDNVPALSGNIVGIKFSDNITAAYTAYLATGGLALVTATTPVAGSPYPIIPSVSDPGGKLANYNLTVTNGGLTVQKATPVFTGTTIPNVVFGQATSTVSGVLSYPGTGGTVFPSGSASVIVNGQSGLGTIQSNGTFTATINTGTLPASGTGLPVALSYSASDPNFNAATGTGAMKVLYNVTTGHQFLQPINPNLTTGNRSSFKIGSTIPAKFQIFKADGVTPVTTATAKISVLKIDSSPDVPINEELLTMPPDDGVNFRLSGSQYLYNLGTKGWTAGTFRIIATLDDGSTITAEVDGRSK